MMSEIIKRLKRIRYYLRWRLFSDIKYGDGIWGRIYAKIAKRYNPMKPRFWQRVKPPRVQLPEGYSKIVPLAYDTGDGWWLHWGALYDGKDKNAYDVMFPEPLCDVVEEHSKSDYTIDWPFILPYATHKDLVKIGFYYV